MTRPLAVALALGLAACRLEPPPDAPPASDPATRSPVAVDSTPLVPDTARAARSVLADSVAAEPPAVSATGLVLPVAGVAPSELRDTFGDARSEGRVHDAIDIHAPRGTPVVAAAAGTVARLFTSERGGRTVYVTAPTAPGVWRVYYYAHLDAYASGLAAGQRVRAGQPLGTVGDSGNAVPGDTHLHFAIWTVADPARFWDGEAVNPYPLLTAR